MPRLGVEFGTLGDRIYPAIISSKGQGLGGLTTICGSSLGGCWVGEGAVSPSAPLASLARGGSCCSGQREALGQG